MTKRSVLTKTRILDVSRSLFSSHGFENTTLDDIITACGITKGAFYYYFKSKEILCENVIDQAAADYQQLADSIDKTAEPIAQLQQFVAKIIELNLSGEWVNCRLILRLRLEPHVERPEIQRKLNEFRQWCMELYGDLIGNCRAANQISAVEPKDAQCQMLISSIIGIVVQRIINPDTPVSVDMAEKIINSIGGNR